ncbi:MAG: hypothetical protein K2Y18_08275 [Alphaproteobacteria bacterium]|jgi:hypothetical protein|nr:hypothetical protein [Alphaproteobacteria bacterium]
MKQLPIIASLLFILLIIFPDCARSMDLTVETVEMKPISRMSRVPDEIEKRESIDENSHPQMKSLAQQFDDMVEDREFDDYLNKLSNNGLVTSLKEHISLVNGEQIIKRHGKRKAATLITLFSGAVVSAIGSLTFLVGEQFPEEFANFINISISNSTADGLGKYLGWSNMAVETLFYTWTISGMLPPLRPELAAASLFHCSKICSWLPTLGEWGLSLASAIPLTLLSWVDQATSESNFKYVVVGSIGLVTLVSNKFFLSLMHRQAKSVWTWLWGRKKTEEPESPPNVLEEAKKAFAVSTVRANEKLKHLSKPEVKQLISATKSISRSEEDSLVDPLVNERWVTLTNYMFADLSFAPAKVNKKAIVLVPSLAVFTAFSWLGLIATVPTGIQATVSSSAALQYTLMVLAGIPLIEIGLSVGGSFGLKLSRIGDGYYSLSEVLTNRAERFLGYIPISLAGIGSFATTATLTIRQFKSTPGVTWALLPSAVLGMDLINISTGMELWDDTLVAIKCGINDDKALFVSHIKFLQYFQKRLDVTPAREVAAILLKLDHVVQKNIMQFVPSMRDGEPSEWQHALRKALREEREKEVCINTL